jgi:phosphatidylserine/phosphatidylglycerophosphate/cardiolipin synthase-like enzyme
MKAALVLLTVVFALAPYWSRASADRANSPRASSPRTSSEAVIRGVCFSPGQSCVQKLADAIDESRRTLDIAIYDLTLKKIGDAIGRAKQRGVKVRIIADAESSGNRNSLIPALQRDGFDVKIWGGENDRPGLMHNKFCLIDETVLETGSYNYTFSATNRNAENQIYIADPKTIDLYQSEFDRLWNEL